MVSFVQSTTLSTLAQRMSAVAIQPQFLATAERHRAILRLLSENGTISVSDIAERFGISSATARRDALSLSRIGRAARRRGVLASSSVPFTSNEQHFRARSTMQTCAKTAIGVRAAQLLPEAGSVFVDAGTTCLEVGRALLERPALKIITNSLPLLELAHTAKAKLVSLGGEVRRTSLAQTGGFSHAWLNTLRFDAAVLGCAGLDAHSGAFTSDIHEAALKSDALRRAGTRILVADGSKWGRSTAIHFAPWAAFSYFVSNQLPPMDGCSTLAEHGVSLRMAA